MVRFYYHINHERLKNGKPPAIQNGLHKGNLEIHVIKRGLEDPAAVPVALERDIPWEQRNRGSILAGTILAIEWADGTAEYEVVCDYDTIDSQCVVMTPITNDKCDRRPTATRQS